MNGLQISNPLSPLGAESFESLLQRTLRDLNLIDDLLRHSVFLDRGHRICCWRTQGTDLDPCEMFNAAYLKMKILAAKNKLRADSTPNMEAFFGLYSQIVLNMCRDQWRKNGREAKRLQSISFSNDESSDEGSFNTDSDINLADPCVDLDSECFLKEFLEFTKSLPALHRRALLLRLENYPDKGVPYEEIARTLSREGNTFSHVTIRTWIRASWKAFLNGRKVSSKKKAVGL